MTIDVAPINLKGKACAITGANDSRGEAFVDHALCLGVMTTIFPTSEKLSNTTPQTISADGRNLLR